MNEIIRTPAMIAGEINLIKEQVRSTALHASIEIGRRLQEAKGLVPVGEWYTWLQENVDYSVRTAQNLMALAAECDAGRGASLEKFPYSKAVLLLSVPEDERDEFVDSHDVEGMSVRELKKQLDEMREKNNELQISMDELLADQNADQSAAEDMKAEIEGLREQLAKAKDAVQQAKDMHEGIQQRNKETEQKLRADLQAAKDEAARAKSEAEKEKQQLEKALSDAKQPMIQQVTPPEVEKELANLRKLANRSEQERDLRGAYDMLRMSFDRLSEQLDRMNEKDAETARKYRDAFAKGLRVMADRIEK